MSRTKALRSISNHTWRHSTYVTELHNVYVRDVKLFLARETEGASEAQTFRRRLEFYSRLCGKVIQHLDKQIKSPSTQQQESARWTYSGLFFAILHNLNDIHQKDLVVLLVALAKVLRAYHRGKKPIDALQGTVESFLVSLLICSERMIQCVQNIAHGIEPTMNKWKSFATLMQTIEGMYLGSMQQEQDQDAFTPTVAAQETSGEVTSSENDHGGALYQENPQLSSILSEEDVAACLATDSSESLLATIIQRSTMQKDFARLAFVLYWLDQVGFPHDTMSSFFSMMLHRMIEMEPSNRNDMYPRDTISILKYARSFEIDHKLKGALHGYLSERNRQSMLQLNLQDSSSLLDCLIDIEDFDQGLLVALFTNLQLWMKAENTPSPTRKANILHSYLSEKSRLNDVEASKWSETFIGYSQLNELADMLIGKDALITFIQKHGCAPFYGKTLISGNHVDENRIWSDIIFKLQKICITLEDTRPYCVALIEHLSCNKSVSWKEPTCDP